MFRGLINDAKSAVGSLVLKYVARASVAVPFVIAVGFAVAAIASMLVERFGPVTGCWILAAGMAAIGIIAAIVVSVREHKEEVAEERKEKADTQEMISDATAQALIQTPVALLGALFATPGGAATGLSVARALGRNWPLVLLLVLGGALFWPAQTAEEELAAEELGVPRKPNGADAYMPSEMRH
jgi:heme exporter protein D